MVQNATSTKEVKMLNRDFTKSNKEYFKANLRPLIAIAVFLVVGIIIFSIFGMNGNFEISGYNEFTISVNDTIAEKYSTHQREIGNIINSYGGQFDTMTIYGEGDDAKYVIRYMEDLTISEQAEINALVADKLQIEDTKISSHIEVGKSVENQDYLYAALSILIIIAIATIFAYARYNGAAGLSVMLANIFGLLGYMSIGTLIRLRIGMSYLAMLVMLTMLISYVAITIFESMHKSSWLMSGDYGTAIKKGVQENKSKFIVLAFAIIAIGLGFVMFGTSGIKYISLNIMFMAVAMLAVAFYVIPFTWSVFITLARKREYRIKSSQIEEKN